MRERLDAALKNRNAGKGEDLLGRGAAKAGTAPAGGNDGGYMHRWDCTQEPVATFCPSVTLALIFAI